MLTAKFNKNDINILYHKHIAAKTMSWEFNMHNKIIWHLHLMAKNAYDNKMCQNKQNDYC